MADRMLNYNVQFSAVQGGTFCLNVKSTARIFSILSLDIPKPYLQSLSVEKRGHWKHTVLHICILPFMRASYLAECSR